VRHGNFSGLRILSAANKGNVGNGVVRRAKRALAHQTTFFNFSHNRMYFCGFQRFLHGHWRQYGRQPFAQHCFPASGRPDKDNIMSAGRRNFHGTFYRFLSFNIGKVKFWIVQTFVKFKLNVYDGLFQLRFSVKKINDFCNIFNAINF